jgi:hypothetical protein
VEEYTCNSQKGNHQKASTQPDQELVRKDERRLWADREPNITSQKSLICGNLVRRGTLTVHCLVLPVRSRKSVLHLRTHMAPLVSWPQRGGQYHAVMMANSRAYWRQTSRKHGVGSGHTSLSELTDLHCRRLRGAAAALHDGSKSQAHAGHLHPGQTFVPASVETCGHAPWQAHRAVPAYPERYHVGALSGHSGDVSC